MRKELQNNTELELRATDMIETSLLNKWLSRYGNYPTDYTIIIRPTTIGVIEGSIIRGDDHITLRFSERRLNDKSTKLPNRDLNEHNIR